MTITKPHIHLFTLGVGLVLGAIVAQRASVNLAAILGGACIVGAAVLAFTASKR